MTEPLETPTEMMPAPAKDKLLLVSVPCELKVVLLTAKAPTVEAPPVPPAAPTIEIVIDPPLVDPESDMFAPPANTNRPDARPVVPRVLPPVDIPADNPRGAETTTAPFELPIETLPAPENDTAETL